MVIFWKMHDNGIIDHVLYQDNKGKYKYGFIAKGVSKFLDPIYVKERIRPYLTGGYSYQYDLLNKKSFDFYKSFIKNRGYSSYETIITKTQLGFNKYLNGGRRKLRVDKGEHINKHVMFNDISLMSANWNDYGRVFFWVHNSRLIDPDEWRENIQDKKQYKLAFGTKFWLGIIIYTFLMLSISRMRYFMDKIGMFIFGGPFAGIFIILSLISLCCVLWLMSYMRSEVGWNDGASNLQEVSQIVINLALFSIGLFPFLLYVLFHWLKIKLAPASARMVVGTKMRDNPKATPDYHAARDAIEKGGLGNDKTYWGAKAEKKYVQELSELFRAKAEAYEHFVRAARSHDHMRKK